MVVDCFTYNGEADILEIRLNILNDYVDEFIIVEAPTTFSGASKPLYYERDKARFERWADKIRYFVIDENWTPEEENLAENSPNTAGAAHWKREFLQKESIKKVLTHLHDDDIVFVGDVDEVWNPNHLESFRAHGTAWERPLKLKCNVYTYYLNNHSSEEFYGPIVCSFNILKKDILNHMRASEHTKSTAFYPIAAWHFTSMGGPEALKKKLTDSYTDESYAHPAILAGIEKRYGQEDFLGRSFTYSIDESNWPQYLKENRQRYQHLLAPDHHS